MRKIKTDLSGENKRTDETVETGKIRPGSLSDYIGQEKLKKTLSVAIRAAKIRNEPLEHCLFYGPPGLGKTTVALLLGNEMGSSLKTVAAPAIEKPGDLASILSSMDEKSILFIDEIHRLPKSCEEVLYSAMEDFCIDITIGSGGSYGEKQTKTMHLSLPKFTLVGATTKAGMLSSPLRDRFFITEKLEYYSNEELVQILFRSAGLFGVSLTREAAFMLAGCSRGTPRIANRLLKQISNLSIVDRLGMISRNQMSSLLKELGYDEAGLDESDRKYLSALKNVYHNGPVGISVLASYLGEAEETLENITEPYLIQKGYLSITPRGRCLIDSGSQTV